MINKCSWICLSVFLFVSGCMEVDPTTIVIDDAGVAHNTRVSYARDPRGREHFPLKITGTGNRQFVFDPKAYSWAAYDEAGNRVMTGAASGGKDICEEDGRSCRTATGTFRVYNKRGPECRSGEYPVETNGGTKMPYCIYFYQGYAIHAGFEVPFGNSSHGCIRVWPSAARWLNEEFIKLGTQVTGLAYDDEDELKVSNAGR